MGTNFAWSLDLQGELVVTGHRGFNQSGADVKLWSLKKLTEPLFTFSEHDATPIAKFCD